jgi:hypothetical protein
MQKVNLVQFEYTEEEIRKEGIHFVPHTGYSNPATVREKERLWSGHLLKSKSQD